MGVRVGNGVDVGMEVGTVRRRGVNVNAMLSPMLMIITRLIMASMARVRLAVERCTKPPVSVCDMTAIIAQRYLDTSTVVAGRWAAVWHGDGCIAPQNVTAY